jgi:hypothetical protein
MNLGESLVLVVSPGVVFGWYSDPWIPRDYATSGRLVDGIAPRVGIGLNVRTSESFAVHPETTFVYTTEEMNRRMIYTFGVAFQFGRLPKALRASDEKKPRSPESPE